MVVTWDSSEFDAKVRAAALRVVVQTTEAIIEEGTRLIVSPPKTGRIYKRENPDRVHQASAPGEAPAGDLGFLAGSATSSYPLDEGPDRIIGIANWGADYALDLELGTEKIAPRPFALPALDFCSPGFLARMQAEMAIVGR